MQVFFSSAVVVDDRIIFNYTNGETCEHDVLKRPRNVVLTMYCLESASVDSQPEFMDESSDDCTYSIYWKRPELCRNQRVSIYSALVAATNGKSSHGYIVIILHYHHDCCHQYHSPHSIPCAATITDAATTKASP